MLSSRLLCSLCISFFFILNLHRMAIAQPQFRSHFCIHNRGNYTANSTYKANLDHLLSTLTTEHQIDYGFYNFSYGQDTKANAIGLCRGDVTPDACRSCLNNSINLLAILCPNQKEAIGWYDECMLRYSDRSLFGFREDSPASNLWIPNNASDPVWHIQVAQNLLEELAGKAASGDSRLKFASGNRSAPNLPTIYGLVQCTPDLSQQECSICLLDALDEIRGCCYGRQGGRILRPSCNFRYDSASFFASTPPSQPASPPVISNRTTDIERNKSDVSQTVVTIIVTIVVTAGLVISICIFIRTRKRKIISAKSPPEDEITDLESLQFDFDGIRIATNEFSDANKLGEGGFGSVYKGSLPNGRNIAVKRLSQFSSQGNVEFKNEAMLVAKLQHRNLVQLLGFCSEGKEKLLIYEFVQNLSLEKFLFDPFKRESLDWERRYKIIGGIARGLVYLHEDSQTKIIHRDLKASNILLDEEMNAKISDFGTAKLFVLDQTQGNTKRIIGTYGYMAPEYAIHGHFSIKSDVFSFGVLVLEIMSGQKNNCSYHDDNAEDLINYAWRNWREGTPLNIIDPSLKSGSGTEMARCIHIGLLCIQEKIVERPTMASVLLMFNSCSVALPRPSQPAFCMNSGVYTKAESAQSQAEVSLNDASVTELYPR